MAFALSPIFEQHAEDRDDRPVTGDDSYLLAASGDDCLHAKFVEIGGSTNDAIRIIASLARLTADRRYERWPAKIDNS